MTRGTDLQVQHSSTQALHGNVSGVADVAQELSVGVLGIHVTRQMYIHFVIHAASFNRYGKSYMQRQHAWIM